MSTCSLCGEPCLGAPESRNPFCATCLTLNFRGTLVEPSMREAWLAVVPPDELREVQRLLALEPPL
jgi:hypothetical protein